jgi:hypothetical protein
MTHAAPVRAKHELAFLAIKAFAAGNGRSPEHGKSVAERNAANIFVK